MRKLNFPKPCHQPKPKSGVEDWKILKIATSAFSNSFTFYPYNQINKYEIGAFYAKIGIIK